MSVSAVVLITVSSRASKVRRNGAARLCTRTCKQCRPRRISPWPDESNRAVCGTNTSPGRNIANCPAASASCPSSNGTCSAKPSIPGAARRCQGTARSSPSKVAPLISRWLVTRAAPTLTSSRQAMPCTAGTAAGLIKPNAWRRGSLRVCWNSDQNHVSSGPGSAGRTTGHSPNRLSTAPGSSKVKAPWAHASTHGEFPAAVPPGVSSSSPASPATSKGNRTPTPNSRRAVASSLPTVGSTNAWTVMSR